jgi:ComF family protein
VYDERAALVVHALKYRERPGLAPFLAGPLAAALPPAPRPDAVLEVPLHPARQRERGYNQAGRLAEALADRIGVPRLGGVLARVRPTHAQARLGPRERRTNLAGAFAVERAGWITGREVLIVDDVLTTGATFDACFEAVIAAGGRPSGVALAWAQ